VNIRILDSALRDLEAVRRFYERLSPGVGDYFLDCLFSDIDSLVIYAGIHRQIFGFHRLLSKRFPYAIYYRVENERILVFRVLDCRRDPDRIQSDLGGSDAS
jgi:plasmid stabilization system protein ParE